MNIYRVKHPNPPTRRTQLLEAIVAAPTVFLARRIWPHHREVGHFDGQRWVVSGRYEHVSIWPPNDLVVELLGTTDIPTTGSLCVYTEELF